MRKSAILLFVAFALCSCGSLPRYYRGYLSQKAAEIAELQRDEADGFYFWTDTHFPDNAGHAAEIMRELCASTASRKVIYGGDAVQNGYVLKEEMARQFAAQDRILSFARFYAVRGNHDYTDLTGHGNDPRETLSQGETAQYIFDYTDSAVVRDASDPSGCYYYFDEPSARLRYIVMDSTDSVEDNKVQYGISEAQRRWIWENAVLSAPQGWHILVVVHVPLAVDQCRMESLLPAGEMLGRIEVERPDLQLVMVQSGHRHHDFQNLQNGVFHVITSADTIDSLYMRSPFVADASYREYGSLREQAIDYVSIASDWESVRMVRIGAGNNRIYHLRPIELAVGDSVTLSSSLSGKIVWDIYDGVGNEFDSRKMNGFWTLSRSVCDISDEGVVLATGGSDGAVGRSAENSAGAANVREAIAVARNQSGDCEFFAISVTEN